MSVLAFGLVLAAWVPAPRGSFMTAPGPLRVDTLVFGRFGQVTVYRRSEHPSYVVLFVSGDGGWNLGVVRMAEQLAGMDAAVVGIDIRRYLAALDRSTESCGYPAADFEALSQWLQRRLGYPAYAAPVLVGYSSGATLVYAVLIQAPRGTFRAAGLAEAKLPALEELVPGETRTIRRLTVQAVAVPHDAASPLAFVVSVGEVSLGHATDLGHLGRGLVDALRGCSAILVESNYDPALLRDGPYPWSLKERILGPLGHLSNGDVARLLERGLGEACRRIVLQTSRTHQSWGDLACPIKAFQKVLQIQRRLRMSISRPRSASR